MMTRKPFLSAVPGAIALALACLACRGTGADVTESGDDAQVPPPAAALARQAGVGLDERLARLDADLTAVLDSDLDDESEAAMLAAEATTDRLLEEEPAAEWLASGYLVEARLRQLQALADRIVAETSRGVARELILEDIAGLRLAVRDLRTQLDAAGNGDAPPPLDSLLAGSPTARMDRGGSAAGATDATETTEQPAQDDAPAPEDGPLGEPVDT